AYVFKRSFGTWALEQDLTPTGTNVFAVVSGSTITNYTSIYSNTRYGYSVAIDGDDIIVGQPYASYDHNGAAAMVYSGAAFMWHRSNQGVWTQEARISSSQ